MYTIAMWNYCLEFPSKHSCFQQSVKLSCDCHGGRDASQCGHSTNGAFKWKQISAYTFSLGMVTSFSVRNSTCATRTELNNVANNMLTISLWVHVCSHSSLRFNKNYSGESSTWSEYNEQPPKVEKRGREIIKEMLRGKPEVVRL